MFDRARLGLKEDGLIIVKENICKEGFILDNDDSSLTRSNAYMLELFEKSNMQVSCGSCPKYAPNTVLVPHIVPSILLIVSL